MRTELLGYTPSQARKIHRIRHAMRKRMHLKRMGYDVELGGFLDIVKGVFRGIKGGVQAGKAAKVAKSAPPVKKPVPKKSVKSKVKSNLPLIIGIGAAGGALILLTKGRK